MQQYKRTIKYTKKNLIQNLNQYNKNQDALIQVKSLNFFF